MWANEEFGFSFRHALHVGNNISTEETEIEWGRGFYRGFKADVTPLCDAAFLSVPTLASTTLNDVWSSKRTM